MCEWDNKTSIPIHNSWDIAVNFLIRDHFAHKLVNHALPRRLCLLCKVHTLHLCYVTHILYFGCSLTPDRPYKIFVWLVSATTLKLCYSLHETRYMVEPIWSRSLLSVFLERWGTTLPLKDQLGDLEKWDDIRWHAWWTLESNFL